MRAPGTKTDKPRKWHTGKSAPGGGDDDVAVVKIRRRKGPLIELHGPPAMGDKDKSGARGGVEGVSGRGKKKRGEGYGARTEYTATGMMMASRPGSPGSPGSGSSPTREMLDGRRKTHTLIPVTPLIPFRHHILSRLNHIIHAHTHSLNHTPSSPPLITTFHRTFSRPRTSPPIALAHPLSSHFLTPLSTPSRCGSRRQYRHQ